MKLLLLFFMVNITIVAQTKVYLNDYGKVIDELVFEKKIKTNLYEVVRKENYDSITFSLSLMESMTRDVDLYNKIKNFYLNKNSNSTILIKYEQRHQSMKELPACVDGNVSYSSVRKKWNKKNLNYIKLMKKKYNTDVIYLYGKYNGEIEDKFGEMFMKDKDELIGDVFKRNKTFTKSGFVLIKPDGNVFLSIRKVFSQKKIISLIKKKSWQGFSKDFKNSKLSNKAIGFFHFKNYFLGNEKTMFYEL